MWVLITCLVVAIVVAAMIIIFAPLGNQGNPINVGTIHKVQPLVANSAATLYERLAALSLQKGSPLRIYGVTGAATYQGDYAMQNLIDAGKIEYIHVSNECSGVYASAADWWSRDIISIFMTTAGPGAGTATPAIMAMYHEIHPAVGILGDEKSITSPDRNEFQAWDPSMFDVVTKRITKLVPNMSIQEISDDVDATVLAATQGVPGDVGAGPAILTTQSDFWASQIPVGTKSPVVTTPTSNPNLSALIPLLKSDRIFIRLGPEVSQETAVELVRTLDSSPRYRSVSLYTARHSIIPYGYQNYLDIAGQLGNQVAESAQFDATLVITIGKGVIYSLLTTDPDPKIQTVVQVLDDSDREAPQTGAMVLRGTPEEYAKSLTQFLQQNPSYLEGGIEGVNWDPSYSLDNAIKARLNTMDTYAGQNDISTYLGKIFRLLTPDSGYNSNSKVSVVTDVGIAAFIAGGLWRSQSVKNRSVFGQFSQIGCSMGWTTGLIRADPSIKQLVIIGDGGFLNMIYGMTDLITAVKDTQGTCLVVVFNDHQYTNVALGEEELFGTTTSVTSTKQLQQHFSIPNYLQSLNANVTMGYDESLIQRFNEGSLESDLYIIYLEGTPSKPIFTKPALVKVGVETAAHI